jgi:hypothetical protein
VGLVQGIEGVADECDDLDVAVGTLCVQLQSALHRFASSLKLRDTAHTRNRDANRALHVILVVRMRRHQPARGYIARRLAEGKTKNQIMRCLKRYIAREIFRALHPPSRPAAEFVA